MSASSLNVPPIIPDRGLLSVSRIDDALLAYPQNQRYRPGRDMPSPSPKLFVPGNIQVYRCVRGAKDCNCRTLRFQ